MERQGWHPGQGWPEIKGFKQKVLDRLSGLKQNVTDTYKDREEQYTKELGPPGHHSISGPYAKIDKYTNKTRAAAAALGETTCNLLTGVCGDARDSVRDWWYSPNAQQREEIKRAQEQELINFEEERKQYMELRERARKHNEYQVKGSNQSSPDLQVIHAQQLADVMNKEYPESYEQYLENKKKGRGGKSKKRRNNKVSKRRRRKSNRLRRKSIRRTRK